MKPVWDFAVRTKKYSRVGLVTTTQEYWVGRYLRAAGLADDRDVPIRRAEDFFDVAVYGKEKAEGIKEAVCKMLDLLPPQGSNPDVDIDGTFARVSPEDRRMFVIFGDSLEGVKQAKSTGIYVVAVLNELTPDEPLDTLADLIIRPAELREQSPHSLIAQLSR